MRPTKKEKEKILKGIAKKPEYWTAPQLIARYGITSGTAYLWRRQAGFGTHGDEARAVRYRLLKELRKKGHSLGFIGMVFGVSKQFVHQALAGTKYENT